MFRLSIFALLVPTLVFAAPVPKEKGKESLYFPTTVGTKRVCETAFDEQRLEYVETVTKVEEKDGVYAVTVALNQTGETQTAVFEVSAKGVFLTSSKGVKLKNPTPMLKLAVKPGETWDVESEVEIQGAKTKYTTTYTMGQEEEIEVRGVKYKAVKVTGAFELQEGFMQTFTEWHAAGVGVVRRETLVPKVKKSSTTELKEFTQSKEEKKEEPKKDK